ncbi:MAG: ATP-dependent DNA helicase RecG [Acidimicrobiales bacterium]
MTERRLRQLSELDVSVLKTVTPRKAAALKALEVTSVLDLLTHYPRRWVDRTNQATIASLREGDLAVVTATVAHTSVRRMRGGKTSAEIALTDDSGVIDCTFFNQPWRAKQFSAGQEVTVFGKVGAYRGRLKLANPIIDLVGDQTGRIVAIYKQSGKANVSSVDIARYEEEALERAGDFYDPVPGRYLDELKLVGRTEAFRSIHRPDDMAAKERARRRLAFDELLRLQLLLVRRKRAVAAETRGVVHDTSPGGLVSCFVARLPFELTGAQERSIRAIATDLGAAHPMSQLLQGDVGSGKTVVAVAALLYAVQGGHQGAFMVPTEVLAEQHYLAVTRLVEGLALPDQARLAGERPLLVELLTSRSTATERARILAGLAAGAVDLLVGTHALLTPDVAFRSLGVVVVDEQHRFGVEQRAALREKGSVDPDLLVMTATPIPRTAAMTVYGDLDHTTLDELPPGRTPVATRWLGWAQAAQAWKRVRAELDGGHQAYVICPLVGGGAGAEEGYEEADDDPADDDEDEPVAATAGRRSEASAAGRLDLEDGRDRQPPHAAVEECERLSMTELAGYSVGLLHGQLPSKHKDAVMSAFRAGEIQALVATTVVEVGVDVTNATVMVIEDADRYGLAQLHQLRGRVGRGADKSYCFLLSDPVSEIAISRLGAMEGTENGFDLAEADLKLRGAGTVLGARQKGRSDLKLASLVDHRDLILKARQVAEALVDEEPHLDGRHRLLWDEVEMSVTEEERQFLFRS